MIQNKKDFRLGVGLIIFCLITLFVLIPWQVGPLSAPLAMQPVIFTLILLLLSGLLVIRSVKNAPATNAKEDEPVGTRKHLKTVCLATIVIIGYSVVFEYLGFILTSFAGMVSLFLLFGVRSWTRILGITIPTMLILYFSFEKLLSAPLPTGLLFELLFDI